MIKRLLPFLLFLSLLLPRTLAARVPAGGWCENGASGNTFQFSYSGCTVTVYDTGTVNLSTIYSDNSGTVKANPFTASATAYWFFYADNGAYDVQFSGGGIPTPFTVTVFLNDASSNSFGTLTATTKVVSPIFVSNNADPADSGIVRLGNNEAIAWEHNPTGTDATLKVDTNNVLTSSVPINATTGFQIGGAATSTRCLRGDGTNFIQSASGCALYSDNLSVFAATTSAQFAGVISDATGTGAVVLGTAPTFTTSITTPIMISAAANPSLAGAVRLGNAELIAWRNSTNSANLTAGMDANNVFSTSTPINANTGFRIGNVATSTRCLRGDGTNFIQSASGCALYSDNLSVFAATTSAQLAGVISDETGSGALVFATSPTLTTPQITPIVAGHPIFYADTGIPIAGTEGTNTTGIAHQLWYTQIFIPHNFTITNVAVLCGGTCGTDKIAIGIWSTTGTLLAWTATTDTGGTALSGANTWQKIALTTPYAAVGPSHYIIGVVTSGTAAGDIQTAPLLGSVCAIASAQGTLASFTPVTTSTTNSCPFAFVN